MKINQNKKDYKMKKFIYFIDVHDITWLVNIDHIVCIEQYDGDAKSMITLSKGRTLWMTEPVDEIYNMIKKHFEENEKANNE